MIVEREFGDDTLARVYVARMREVDPSSLVEFVESLQPPLPREQKWVLIVSSLFGCPAGCGMCDAGGRYRGRLTADEIIEQITFMVRRRYPGLRVPVPRFKIQFARMGEPLYNPALPEVLERLPGILDAPGLEPCLSTIAPRNCEPLLEEIRGIKDRLYTGGRFQMQFSIHSTDEAARERLLPVPRWDLARIADFGRRFHRPADKRITLNFTVIEGIPIEAAVLRRHFDPRRFLLKLTPLNPTERATANDLRSGFDPRDPDAAGPLIRELEREGFRVILSIGELRENQIGSNCGQFVTRLGEGRELLSRSALSGEAYTVAASAGGGGQ
jgi:23S rRNA (adenine2503-C2)-methyltransferase